MKPILRLAQLSLFVIAMMFLNGCASALYSTGKGGDVLRPGTDRAAIVEQFGEPIRQGTDKFGHDYEVFRAKGKIVPPADEVGALAMGEVMTLGAGDAIALPMELMKWPFQATGEKDVTVWFRDGKYADHMVRRAKASPIVR